MDWRKANISLTLIQPTVYMRTPLIEKKLAKVTGKKTVIIFSFHKFTVCKISAIN